MDAFYEESAVNGNAKKESKRYRLFHIVSYIFMIIAVILLVSCVMYIPVGGDNGSGYGSISIFLGMQGAFFLAFWFLFYKLKRRYNVSYDYCFVSGELRISKVFNINKRKLVARIECEDMIQIGDIDNGSYDRFKADPMTKEVICTPNVEPAEGKFFMYVLANYNGKKLYVLECRELLLMNIMKFAKRGVLESDYVMQERKQK
ncbi:MAG: hypothetical protein IJ514_00700 [Clostridia bacterium]|nr:hypothetical protein [Clostridia bacterium]